MKTVLKQVSWLASIPVRGGYLMPKFVIEREIPGAGNLSDAELKEIALKSVAVLKGMGPEGNRRSCNG
jgi:hypothetical protein